MVQAHLTVPEEEAIRALILTGSHDPALDPLAHHLAKAGVALHSAHQGSMGGLIALKKRVCHGAPMHLLAEDGTYNAPYLSRHMPGEDLVIFCLAGREQGIISPREPGARGSPEGQVHQPAEGLRDPDPPRPPPLAQGNPAGIHRRLRQGV